jgi:hypothetical protein
MEEVLEGAGRMGYECERGFLRSVNIVCILHIAAVVHIPAADREQQLEKIIVEDEGEPTLKPPGPWEGSVGNWGWYG